MITTAGDALHLKCAMLKFLGHESVQNPDDGEWKEVVNGRLDYRYVPDENVS